MSPISRHTAPRGCHAPTVRVSAFLACVVSAWAMTACTTAADVGYLVVERDMITVALFPPCGQRCPVLAPGASVTVPYTAIAAYSPEVREARVFWWSYRRNADGTRSAQGAMQTTSITL